MLMHGTPPINHGITDYSPCSRPMRRGPIASWRIVFLRIRIRKRDKTADRVPAHAKAGPIQVPVWDRCVLWAARLVLAGYVLILAFRAHSRNRLSADEPPVQLTDLVRIADWAAEFLVTIVKTGVCFALFGFLVGVALNQGVAKPRWLPWLWRWGWQLLLGAGLLVLLSLAESGTLPNRVFTIVALVGHLAGLCVGRTCLRGPKALARLLPLAASTVVLALMAAGVLLLLALETAPLPFEPPQVTSVEKRMIRERLQSPATTSTGTRRLQLSEHEANLVATMGLKQVMPTAKARIGLGQDTIDLAMSAEIDWWSALPRWLNIEATCEVAADGESPVRPIACRIGKISVPQFLLQAAMEQTLVVISGDHDLKRLSGAIGTLRVEPDLIEAEIVARGTMSHVVPSILTRLSRDPNVTARTRIYYNHLTEAAKDLPQEHRFCEFTQAAFALARERSVTADPVLENRAALFGLAVILGHYRVEHLIGPVRDHRHRALEGRHARNITLRGRRDWCQHFYLSAALALASNETLSDGAGLFKEELDAGEGGSGFSFSDLMADRAGTRLALAATRDEAAARWMQQQLADGFLLGDLFPPAADLPEGIADAELLSQYGGVGGDQYNQMAAEIERRLDTGLTGRVPAPSTGSGR